MARTFEAVADERGHVALLEPLRLGRSHRALVTILDEPPRFACDTALVSEPALATDWSRPEEDEAWSHLQPVR
ncbi:MAG: hypothetical protein FJX72_19595 [Armatimonadetes bacterium]|nr:hypothetical protein [Armatimonadota bacterium]